MVRDRGSGARGMVVLCAVAKRISETRRLGVMLALARANQAARSHPPPWPNSAPSPSPVASVALSPNVCPYVRIPTRPPTLPRVYTPALPARATLRPTLRRTRPCSRQVCGKVGGPPLLGWRQHPRQHTRTHGRLSIDSLRTIKVHFLLRRSGPLFTATRVVIVSVGSTLSGWEADVKAHPRSQGKQVLAVEWRPTKRGKADGGKPAGVGKLPAAVRREQSAGVASEHGAPKRVVRLWAFGNEAVRQRVREQVANWTEGDDWFVA